MMKAIKAMDGKFGMPAGHEGDAGYAPAAGPACVISPTNRVVSLDSPR